MYLLGICRDHDWLVDDEVEHSDSWRSETVRDPSRSSPPPSTSIASRCIALLSLNHVPHPTSYRAHAAMPRSMPQSPDVSQAEEYEYASDEETRAGQRPGQRSASSNPYARTGGSATPTSTQYALPTGEKLRGLANRIIFSRYYVLFYFLMMCLSTGTVIISLVATRECLFSTGSASPALILLASEGAVGREQELAKERCWSR